MDGNNMNNNYGMDNNYSNETYNYNSYDSGNANNYNYDSYGSNDVNGYNYGNDGTYGEAYESYPQGQGGSNTLAIISLICGIVSIVCCWGGGPIAIAGIVCGIIGINKCPKRGLAIAGLVVSIASMVIGMAVGAFSSVTSELLSDIIYELQSTTY